jgi:hypothetical protein
MSDIKKNTEPKPLTQNEIEAAKTIDKEKKAAIANNQTIKK